MSNRPSSPEPVKPARVGPPPVLKPVIRMGDEENELDGVFKMETETEKEGKPVRATFENFNYGTGRKFDRSELQRIQQLKHMRMRWFALRLEMLRAVGGTRDKLAVEEQEEFDTLGRKLASARLYERFIWTAVAPPTS